ncbi:MAG: sodium:solute symporter family transporter, partial [Fusobacteriaceae bacterium]
MISKIDVIIIMVYLFGMIAIGYFSGKGNKTKEDYLIASRSMPWIPVALSVTATMISANSLIGGPGWSYKSGMGPFMVNITVPLAVFFAVYVTAPIIYHLKITSIYQYMEYRLGGICRNLAVLQFFINSLIQVSSMVFVPALIIQTITGWNFNLIVPAIVVISIIYTLLGGIKAVIWTDTVQSFIVLVGLIFIIVIPLKKLDANLFNVLELAKNAGKLSMFDFSFNLSKENTFWSALIGGTVMWVRYFSFDQAQIQRIATSKSLKDIKKSLSASAIIMNVIYFIVLLVGLILWVFYGNKKFENSNQVMIDFILKELPIGVVGLVIAGTFAAAMSSVDSLLNSMTTVFIKDIYEKYFVKEDKEVSLRTTMLISSVLGVIIVFIVILAFGNTVKSVLDMVGKYISYFTGPACAIFILALFTRKANDKGVSIGFVLGFIFSYIIIGNLKPFWLWNPFIGFILTFVLGYLASLLFKRDESKSEFQKYTVFQIRKTILQDNKSFENGISLLPFSFGKFEKIILYFFILQFLVIIV